MNVSLVKVSRYSYSDSDGIYHDGCNFCVLEPIETNDSNIGYEFKRFACKYELYEKLVSIFKEGKPGKNGQKFR